MVPKLDSESLINKDAETRGCAVPNSGLCETVTMLKKAYVVEQQQLAHVERTRVVFYTEPLCGGTGGIVLCTDRAVVRYITATF
jgi:hypothetical protein